MFSEDALLLLLSPGIARFASVYIFTNKKNYRLIQTPVNDICARLINNVISSKLDYNINQTPYSLYFSVRKKFSKCATETNMNIEESDMIMNENQTNVLRQELVILSSCWLKV